MRLEVVHDKKGKILAAVRVPDSAEEMTHHVSFAPDKGQSTAVVYVPAEHAHWEFIDICQRLRIDVRTKSPRLVLRTDDEQPDPST